MSENGTCFITFVFPICCVACTTSGEAVNCDGEGGCTLDGSSMQSGFVKWGQSACTSGGRLDRVDSYIAECDKFCEVKLHLTSGVFASEEDCVELSLTGDFSASCAATLGNAG